MIRLPFSRWELILIHHICECFMTRKKVPFNYTDVSGTDNVFEYKELQEFESTLEHDFIRLLRFDTKNVKSYVSQKPVIHYQTDCDKKRRYTPDVFVEYRDGRKIIYEVKPRKLLWKNWTDLKPKFKQAIRYAINNGYKFKIITEIEIRTSYLKNVQFLERYLTSSEIDPRSRLLIAHLQNLRFSTPDELIRVSAKSPTAQMEILYVLWQLVANRTIDVDLSVPLTMNSRLFLS